MPPDTFRDLTLDEFARRLASDAPVPGGGSACAVAGALAVSLAAMVARLSVGRERYAAYQATHERAAAEADGLRERLLELAQVDADAYAAYGAALNLPRASEEETAVRRSAVSEAARGAALVPLATVRACRAAAALLEALAGRSNVNAASDLAVGALLVEAAARGAAENVRINLPAVRDQAFAESATRELDALIDALHHDAAATQQLAAAGVAREPEAT